ncbi:MAG TPA: 50S ribosomal protein L11 methyltransferase, partial [Gemmatimonadaceae bacterium]|nr:50S ribosomal protein L11 methyltransferase [Gemmatimonadaceae bacterium]
LLLPLVAPADVITANIISSAIVELLPLMSETVAPGGFAVLAGILESEHRVVVDALRDNDWQLRRTHVEEEWWSALAQHH